MKTLTKCLLLAITLIACTLIYSKPLVAHTVDESEIAPGILFSSPSSHSFLSFDENIDSWITRTSLEGEILVEAHYSEKPGKELKESNKPIYVIVHLTKKGDCDEESKIRTDYLFLGECDLMVRGETEFHCCEDSGGNFTFKQKQYRGCTVGIFKEMIHVKFHS